MKKITDDDARAIMTSFRLRHTLLRELSTKTLAAKFGISTSMVNKIGRHGLEWREHDRARKAERQAQREAA